MFQDESWAKRFVATPKSMMRKQYKRYTRASLTAILRLLKNSKRMDWGCFIERFGGLVLGDPNLNMGAHYLQELFVHLQSTRVWIAYHVVLRTGDGWTRGPFERQPTSGLARCPFGAMRDSGSSTPGACGISESAANGIWKPNLPLHVIVPR